MPGRRESPTLLLRLKALLYHGRKILFFRWPGYTFDDLAACQDSLDGPAFQRVARRMAEDEEGRKILAERPTIGVGAVDWERLSGLPIDTLGYSLWHHLYSNGIFHDVRDARRREVAAWHRPCSLPAQEESMDQPERRPVRSAIRSALRWVGLWIAYLVLFSAGGALFGPPLDAEAMRAAQEPAGQLGLLAMAAIDVAVLGAWIRRSRLPPLALAVTAAAVFYGVKTFTGTLEALYFMRNLTPEMIPGLFAMTLPLALLWTPLAVWALRQPAAGEAPWQPLPLGRGELAAKVVLLAGVVYPALFFGFGYFVAWQSPEVREFYGGVESTFLAHMRQALSSDPLLYPFEVMRGLLWILLALPVLRTTRGPWWAGGLLAALLFSLVLNDVHLLANPLMPGPVRWAHFWETSVSNFLWAWAIAAALSFRWRPQPSVLAAGAR